MTDPADHQNRIREIEARLASAGSENGFYLTTEKTADLRYLLSLVAEKDQRIEALEATLWYAVNMIDPFYMGCPGCDDYPDAPHASNCIVLTLSAPETVKTQGIER